MIRCYWNAVLCLKTVFASECTGDKGTANLYWCIWERCEAFDPDEWSGHLVQDYGNELDAPTHVYRGYVSSAVLLYDCEYLTVENLEISNKGGVFGETYSAPHKMNRTGVAGIAKNRGTLHEIHLSNLYIHDVEGNVYDKHMNNGGIYFTCLKPEAEEKTGVARYENVSVRGCHLEADKSLGNCCWIQL